MNKTFKEILINYLCDTLKKYILFFRIPGIGDKFLKIIKQSRAVNLMCNGWIMLSLM